MSVDCVANTMVNALAVLSSMHDLVVLCYRESNLEDTVFLWFLCHFQNSL